MILTGIYQIQSKIKPNKTYIGSAVNIYSRWKQHLNELRSKTHHNLILQHHYNKYGISDFQFSVLLGCDKEDLIDIEQFFIDVYNPWFNICKIAGSRLGSKCSEETNRKNSVVHRGQVPWNKGKTNIYSEECLKKMSESTSGKNHPNYGKHHSEKTKQKMRKPHGAVSKETRQKMSESGKRVWKLKKLKIKEVKDESNSGG